MKKVVEIEDLPVLKSKCPRDGYTTRQEMKDLMNQLEVNYPDMKEKVLTVLSNIDIKNIWNQRK